VLTTSIIIPTLNEAGQIAETLAAISRLEGEWEVLVADGGSDDDTVKRAEAAGAVVLRCPRGRGPQMHAAATMARGDVLWFLHADTRPPAHALHEIRRTLADERVAGGSFTPRFSGASLAARQMTWIYPALRWLGLSYGDAGMFVRRSAYESIGGFRPYSLFEDLDLVRRIRRHGRFVRLHCQIETSSRRFERAYGRTWATWITLQILYWIGVPPNRLARWYHNGR